jgi:hypothetical protein
MEIKKAKRIEVMRVVFGLIGALLVVGLVAAYLGSRRPKATVATPSASGSALAAPSASSSAAPTAPDNFKLMKRLREGHWANEDGDEKATVFLVNRIDTLDRQQMWYSKYSWVFWWVHTIKNRTLWFNCGIDSVGSEHWRVLHCSSDCKHDWRVAYCTALEVDSDRLGLVMGPSWYGVSAPPFEGMPFTKQPPSAVKIRLYVNNKDDLRFQLGDGNAQVGFLVHKKPCGLPPGPPGLVAGDEPNNEPNIPLGVEIAQPLLTQPKKQQDTEL